MLGAIPNPKKSFELDFDTQRIMDSLKFIPALNTKYKFSSSNDLLKTYRFEALEFLSLGIYADITVNSISESKSRIEIEISRKVGAFDQAHEVSKANDHITVLATLITRCLQLTPEQQQQIQVQAVNPSAEKPVQSKWTMVLITLLFGSFGIHRLMMGYSNWWLMLLTFGACGWWTIIDLIRIISGKMNMADGTALR
jgi:hypothetical protein